MRASRIVHHLCSRVAASIDLRRYKLMLSAVESLLHGRRLTLTSLGRFLPRQALPKHRIKTMDRFLGNRRVQREIPLWYRALARKLLKGNFRPVVLIDWTHMVGEADALVAAVAFSGRAIPIYAEVHPHRLYGNPRVQENFLAALADILPPKSRPILIADAGFKTPFFEQVRARNWDFVIRLRGNCMMRRWGPSLRGPHDRLSFEDAFKLAGKHPKNLGQWTPYSAQGALKEECRVVLAAHPREHQPKRRNGYARSAVEPWLLATTLLAEPPGRIVALYGLRMQIELTFRDAKNSRFGWGLEHGRTRDSGRQAVLFLIACIALATTLLVGADAERNGRAAGYQANTIRNRRVQSLCQLGTFVLLGEHARHFHRLITRERDRIVRFLRTGLQLRLPYTVRHYGKWR